MIEEYKEHIEQCKNISRFLLIFSFIIVVVGGMQFVSSAIVAVVIAVSEMAKSKLYEELIKKQSQIDVIVSENQIIKGNWDRMYEQTRNQSTTN